MDHLATLIKEHEDIERELLELETITSSDEINYSNLIHVFKKLRTIWESHEEKEEVIFPIICDGECRLPVEKMLFDHKELRKYKDTVIAAINSGNNSKLHQVCNNELKIVITKLRKHMDDEDGLLYSLSTDEIKEKIEKVLN